MNFFTLEQLRSQLQDAIAYQDLEAGQILFHQGDLTRAMFAVESGQIRLASYTKNGQAINHYIVRLGESFAEAALFQTVYDCVAIAVIPSRVAIFPKQPLLEALRQQPSLSEAFMAQLASRFHQTKILLELRSIRSARDRVLRYLQLTAQPDQKTVNLEYPLKDIAEDLGITPEALSRALAKLESEGAIARTKRRITLCE